MGILISNFGFCERVIAQRLAGVDELLTEFVAECFVQSRAHILREFYRL